MAPSLLFYAVCGFQIKTASGYVLHGASQ